ncbi:MAG TPA: VOC family protein [Actinomycetota bacterium]|nr:VOC family protein [Actinomycetota bacterium]
MGSSVYSITIDCADPSGLASFWEQVLDYKRTYDETDEVVIEPRDGSGNALLFLRVPDDKKVKNRIHLDLKPTDQAAEVERVKGLGATEVDIGQGDVSWVVLADPEGNEFCILRPR